MNFRLCVAPVLAVVFGLAAFCCALLQLGLPAHAGPVRTLASDASYHLQVSMSEARDSLNGLIFDMKERSALKEAVEFETPLFVSRLLRSYRTARGPNYLSIQEGPFLGFLLSSKALKDSYSDLYRKNYDEKVLHITVEDLFDVFMDLIVDRRVPEEAKKAAKKVDVALAKKVRAGKSSACILDTTPYDPKTHRGPSILKELYVKVTSDLHLPFPNACYVRKLVFMAAKKDLFDALNNPAVTAALKAAFGPKFRENFAKSVNTERSQLPATISTKFRGDVDPLWGPATPLVEFEDSGTHVLTMKGFAAGLKADLGVADVMIRSGNSGDRGLAAALFYAAANRILLLVGGDEAQWNGREYEYSEKDAYHTPKLDPRRLGEPPQFKIHPFGGWGAMQGQVFSTYANWNIEDYDPVKRFQIFPSLLVYGPHGVPSPSEEAEPVESLQDLADLMSGLAMFLKFSRPDGSFGAYFAQGASLADITDVTKPTLFPKDGRLLAIGAVGAILKNLTLKHTEKVPFGTAGAGLGVLFREQVTLNGPDGKAASIQSVSQALLAVSDLVEALTGDGDVPPSLAANLPDLSQAIQVAALELAGAGQTADGGFNERMAEPLATGRKTSTAAIALRALTRAYTSLSRYPAMRLAIKSGWLFLDKLWGDGLMPPVVEGSSAHEPISPSLLWSLQALWDETQAAVRPDLASELDWGKWDRRFELSRQRLIDQLGTDVGPQLIQ